MTATPPTSSFETILSAFGNNTGVVVPPEVLDALGAGKRPRVRADLDGYQYRTTVGVMNGQSLMSVSAAIRKETGLAAGDAIRVTLTLDESAREVTIPVDFATTLRENAGTEEFFATLSNSLQRYHIDQITSAKTDETRKRRIAKAIGLFLDARQR